MAREPYFLTIPPLPPTRPPDLAAARELIGADVLARHYRRAGRDVRFVATSLEHGHGVERAAYERGGTPKGMADEWAERCAATLKALNVHHDGLTRTTEPQHQHVVKAFFLKLFDQGDIYKATATSRHCARCDETVLDKPVGGKSAAAESQEREGEAPPPPACPVCGELTTETEEEAFFLRASKYQKAVRQHIENHPEFIVPEARREAVLKAVAGGGLPDLRISRARGEWTVPVPINPQHAIAPAFDTLITYLTASGYLADPQMFERYWPPRVQIVAPESLETHALAWSAVLLAVGLELPQQLLVRGALRPVEGASPKLAASLADPAALAGRVGADAVRLGVLHTGACTEEGRVGREQIVELANEYLGDGLGRLADLTAGAVDTWRNGAVPRPGALRDDERRLADAASALTDAVGERIEAYDFAGALDEVGAVVAAGLDYAGTAGVVDLPAEASEPRRLSTALYVLAEVCRLVAEGLQPLLPGAAAHTQARFGLAGQDAPPEERKAWGLTKPQSAIQGTEPLFPRVSLAEE